LRSAPVRGKRFVRHAPPKIYEAVIDMPRPDFAPLTPELICRDLAVSRDFYIRLLGFDIRYARDGFVYLAREGAQIMLEQLDDNWITGPLEPPFGRGINLQIEVSDVRALRAALAAAEYPVFRDLEEAWYRADTVRHGHLEFLVQDPDGYLLRFFEDLGTRSA
jgi:catechol 2,3-dioxygenase-like lactoylglutathione lyase family enzyme